MRDALKLASKSSIEEVVMHSQLIESQIMYLEQLGELPDGGSVLYDKAKRVSNRDCVSSVDVILTLLLLLVMPQCQRPAVTLSKGAEEFKESV